MGLFSLKSVKRDQINKLSDRGLSSGKHLNFLTNFLQFWCKVSIYNSLDGIELTEIGQKGQFFFFFFVGGLK